MNRLFGSTTKQSAEDVRAAQILHFDHVYLARLVGYSEGACPDPVPSIADDNSTILLPGRQCKLHMDSTGVKLAETIGASISEMLDRVIFRSGYFSISELAWDHSVSGVKFSTESLWVVVHVENSLELERDIRLRLKGAAVPGAKFPLFQYVGMFAGPTKPKPFQRKRPNLTEKSQGKLPPLKAMRQWAVEHHRGALKPLMPGAKGRVDFALDHIHQGQVTFPVLPAGARGPGGFGAEVGANCTLVINYDGLHVQSNHLSVRDLLFASGVQEIIIRDSPHTSNADVGLEVSSSDGIYFVPTGMTTIRYARAAVEFFWNRHRFMVGFPAMPCSVHGRQVLKCHTLQGEKDAPPAPIGNLEIEDVDGNIVKAAPEGHPGPTRRRGGRPAGPGLKRRSSIFGGGSSKPLPPQRPEVLGHWDKIVKHQGWLLKRGGAAKQWLRRYFVLFSTCQGHFLTYYSDVRDCPLYNERRSERNTVDLCKVTFIRPVSTQEDSPEHAFDIVTIERDWTLGAEDHEDMALWLQMITRAVDEDVSIVPDDELEYRVKALSDPTQSLSRNDYSTVLRVGSMGVSVSQQRAGDELAEIFFWCYTDFYKWSTIAQDAKLALLMSVFRTPEFDSKQEFIFRCPISPQLATSIEYYIEKFMSIMHMNGEDAEDAAPSPGAAEGGASQASGIGNGTEEEDLLGTGTSHNLIDNDWVDNEADRSAELSALNRKASDDLLNFNSLGNGAAAAAAATAAAAPATASVGGSLLSDLGIAEQQQQQPTPAAPVDFSASPFDDDPFGQNGAAAAGNGVPAAAALGLPFVILSSLPHNILNVVVHKDGSIIRDPNFPLEVDAKVEYRGSQARMTLTFQNAMQETITDLAVGLSGGDPSDALRTNDPAVDPTEMLPTQHARFVLLCECMKPFTAAPTVTVAFKNGATPYKFDFVTPFTISGFVEPTNMSPPDFQGRWGTMSAPGQFIQAVVTPESGAAQAATVTELFMRTKSFGICSNATPNATGILSQCFAGTLRTGKETQGPDGETRKVSAGCLVVVETNEAAGVYRLNVRSVHQSVTAAVFHDLKSQLERVAPLFA